MLIVFCVERPSEEGVPHRCRDRTTGGYSLHWIFWEHENLSALSVIWLISADLY